MKKITLILVFLFLSFDVSLAEETNTNWHNDFSYTDLTGVWKIKNSYSSGSENFNYLSDKKIYFYKNIIETPEKTFCKILSTNKKVNLNFDFHNKFKLPFSVDKDTKLVLLGTNCKKEIAENDFRGIINIIIFGENLIFAFYGGIEDAAYLELTKKDVEQNYYGELKKYKEKIELIELIENQTYPKPKYELISEEILDEVCVSSDRCSTTVKKTLSSSDGFLFEIFQSDGTDSVWCYGHFDDVFPCSTIGDYGGGRDELTVTSTKTKQKVKIINGSPAGGRITRVSTPINYPYIVFEKHTGGMSCCMSYELYSKENFSLQPFILDNTRGDLLITKDNKTFFTAWEELFKDHTRQSAIPGFIDDLITAHFNNQ